MSNDKGLVLLGIGWIGTITLTDVGIIIGIFSSLIGGLYYLVKLIKELKNKN